MSKSISSVGRSWEDARKELFTPAEIAASDLRVAFMGELMRVRQEMGVSQKKRCEAACYCLDGEGEAQHRSWKLF